MRPESLKAVRELRHLGQEYSEQREQQVQTPEEETVWWVKESRTKSVWLKQSEQRESNRVEATQLSEDGGEQIM